MRQEKIKVLKMRDQKQDTPQVNYIELMNSAKNLDDKEKYRKMN